jgi:hypothetical protein
MLNFFLSVYEIKDLKKSFFKFNLILNILQTFFILPFFFIRNNFFTGIIVFIFILLTTYLNLNSKFHERPLSFILIFITTLFINIPLIFITYCGIDYNYEYVSKKIPFSRDVYTMLFPYSVIWLFFSWLAIYLGICLSGIKKLYLYQKKVTIRSDENIQERFNVRLYEKFKAIKFSTIVFWAILVTIFSLLQSKNFYEVFNYNVKNLIIYNYLKLIFIDEILFFLLLIINLKISQCKDFNLNLKKYFLTIFILIFLFLISKIYAGSKGALYSLLIIFFLNFIILSQFPKTKMIFFSRTLLLFMPLLLLFLFDFGEYIRNFLRNHETQIINDFFNLENTKVLLTRILYRISTSGIHQYILIFVSYINSIIDLDTSISLLKYMSYSLINLLTPGTPFRDYYSPSSQFLNDIVNYGTLFYFELNYRELIITFNTQPFSIWGFFLIIFNLLSFFSLFIYSILMSFMFKKKNLYLKIFILNLFFGLFFNYGFENTLFNNVVLAINNIIVFNILFFLSRAFSKSTNYK